MDWVIKMKCIKIDSCDKCPYSDRTGYDVVSKRGLYSCKKIMNYNNRTVLEGLISRDCPLENY